MIGNYFQTFKLLRIDMTEVAVYFLSIVVPEKMSLRLLALGLLHLSVQCRQVAKVNVKLIRTLEERIMMAVWTFNRVLKLLWHACYLRRGEEK